MKKPAAPNLLIPVETLNREFDGKLLLALVAAELGLQPILGGRTAMHDCLPSLPRSIYLAKGVRAGSRLIFSLLEKFGHSVVAMDEEALVRFSDEIFLMRLDPETFSRVRLLFAWGHDNAEVWRRFPAYHGAPILEVGNPRVDMMRPDLRAYYEPEIRDIRERFGDFALMNTNFSSVNHFIPDMVRFKTAADAPPEERERLKGGLVAHKRALFEAFKAVLPQLSETVRPGNLVVRPHPSEAPEAWQRAAAGLDNVHVVHEGNVVPWLAAARALIHNGCTSAVESAVVGTPAFAFRPVTSPEFDLALPNGLSTEIADPATLAGAVGATVSAGGSAGRKWSAAQEAMLAEHISSVQGALSCERIASALIEHQDDLRVHTTPGKWLRGYLRHRRRARSRISRTQRSTDKSSAAYTQHKFPGLTEAGVNSAIARFAAVLNRFEGLRAVELRRNILRIGYA